MTINLETGLVSTGSVWKYLDTGTNLGVSWRSASFNDDSWASGRAQLGYGDGDEATLVGYGPDQNNKYITTYFRRRFIVPDTSLFTNLLLRVLRDDGAVVYLNGLEVFRSNMPAGAITYTTLALASVGGADESTTFYPAIVSTNRLVSGTNVFAVEIHQGATNSSDISFDLELLGLRPIVPPTLSIRRNASDAILSWSAFTQGFRPELTSILSATNNWTGLTNQILTANGQNMVAVKLTAEAELFRLRKL